MSSPPTDPRTSPAANTVYREGDMPVIAQALKDTAWPQDKRGLREQAVRNQSDATTLEQIAQLPEGRYDSLDAVVRALATRAEVPAKARS